MRRPYAERIKFLLTPLEQRIFGKLSTPQKAQNYLDTLPVNFELKGDTSFSPRWVMREKTAHCFEGAVFAAAVFAYHGRKPLLMDLRTIPEDEDHVVALFRQKGRWGAVSKTNHAILRYRDPVYASVRELAMSYFHEYVMRDGRKSLLAYSAPFDLSRFDPKKWVTAEKDLDWLAEALDGSRHFPTVPKKIRPLVRKASAIEIRAMGAAEWSKAGRRRTR